MSYNRTPSEILKHGLSQAACHGAPADVMANLRAAERVFALGDRIRAERKLNGKSITEFVPSAPVVGVVADE